MDLTHRTLSYDRNGNVSSISDSVAMIDASACHTGDTLLCDGFEHAAAPVGTADRSYRYDALDRLTKLHSAVYGDYPYGYDPLGNIRSARFATYQYDAATNLLTAHNGDPIIHDTRGNTTLANQRGMSWNQANELIADSLGSTSSYDARGWRVRRKLTSAGSNGAGGHARYSTYDHVHRLMQRVDNGVATDFIYLGTKPIARIQAGTTTYLQTDYHASPLFETGPTGHVTAKPFYLGYGNTSP